MKPIRKVQAILYDVKDDKHYVLILHRVLNWTGWEFLKGTMEGDESVRETIEREIKEETSLNNITITKQLGKKIPFKSKKQEYEIVDVFLVKADMNDPISLEQEIIEHDNYKWVTVEEALTLLTYDNTRNLLKEVHRNLFK